VQAQNDLSAIALQEPPVDPAADALRKLIDEKSANKFQGKLENEIDHHWNDVVD
jgi:hypothetical protein